MRVLRTVLACLAILSFAAGYTAQAEEPVVSTVNNVTAYFDYYGYSIKPIGTMVTPGDHGPTQLFEIVRPAQGGFSIGRIYASCSCIRVTAGKKNFGSGESAVLTLRNVQHSSGNTYSFYVQITSPVNTTIRYDTYVISDTPAPEGSADEVKDSGASAGTAQEAGIETTDAEPESGDTSSAEQGTADLAVDLETATAAVMAAVESTPEANEDVTEEAAPAEEKFEYVSLE